VETCNTDTITGVGDGDGGSGRERVSVKVPSLGAPVYQTWPPTPTQEEGKTTSRFRPIIRLLFASRWPLPGGSL
jgi:hypothetical protein